MRAPEGFLHGKARRPLPSTSRSLQEPLGVPGVRWSRAAVRPGRGQADHRRLVQGGDRACLPRPSDEKGAPLARSLEDRPLTHDYSDLEATWPAWELLISPFQSRQRSDERTSLLVER